LTEEELQAEILKLQDENKTLKTTNETLTADKEKLGTRITELQEHNQKLFLKLTTTEQPEKKDKPDEPQALEDFAKTLKI
jgi:chromosome condensin MukBEF MukE localization factor